jgi:hypothetical protein
MSLKYQYLADKGVKVAALSCNQLGEHQVSRCHAECGIAAALKAAVGTRVHCLEMDTAGDALDYTPQLCSIAASETLLLPASCSSTALRTGRDMPA